MCKEPNLDLGTESAVVHAVKGTKTELLWDTGFTLLHGGPRRLLERNWKTPNQSNLLNLQLKKL